MFRSSTLLGLRLSGFTTIAAIAGFCDPSGYINASETVSTAWAGAPIPCDVLGSTGATPQVFRFVVSEQVTEFYKGRIVLRVPWTVTNTSPGAATRATIKAEILAGDAGASVPVATAQGAPRDVSQANKYVEIIALDIGSNLTLTPGQVIEVRLTPTVTTVGGAGNTYLPTLRHDPATIADQLVAEFQDSAVNQ